MLRCWLSVSGLGCLRLHRSVEKISMNLFVPCFSSLWIYSFTHLFVCLFDCLFACLFVCLFVYSFCYMSSLTSFVWAFFDYIHCLSVFAIYPNHIVYFFDFHQHRELPANPMGKSMAISAIVDLLLSFPGPRRTQCECTPNWCRLETRRHLWSFGGGTRTHHTLRSKKRGT